MPFTTACVTLTKGLNDRILSSHDITTTTHDISSPCHDITLTTHDKTTKNLDLTVIHKKTSRREGSPRLVIFLDVTLINVDTIHCAFQ